MSQTMTRRRTEIGIIRAGIALLLLLLTVPKAEAQEFIPLWPEGKMPNSKGLELEHLEDNERITQIEEPGIYAFFTSTEENSGSAVLVLPSGGYWKLVYQKGGIQLAKWLNSIGINAFVLLYRLPTSPDLLERHWGPLQDGQRAMKQIRALAVQHGIDSNRIGVMGASAGGHLSASLCTIDEDHAMIGDSLDSYAFAPDFQILISPVISFTSYVHEGSNRNLLGESPGEELVRLFSCDLNVEPGDPPCFLVHANNDRSVDPMHSINYYKALKSREVSASLHIFPFGGHNIMLRNNPGSANLWTSLCESWLKETGLLKE
jgi:acetyl esterase/lipase